MISTNLSTHDYESVWWEEQLLKLTKGKNHYAHDSQYGADFDNVDRSMTKLVKDSGLPIKQVADLSDYTPGDDCEFTYKLATAYESEDGSAVVAFFAYRNSVTVRVWSNTQEKSKHYCDAIMKKVPVKDPPDPREDMIPMAFWQYDPDQGGASCSIKDIQCPSISEIAANYPEDVITSVTELGSLDRPDELGKILIFHGPPGSGKTHAVRALGREWANNANSTVELVVDPELMLNSPSYIRSILLNGDKAESARRTINKRMGRATEQVITESKPDEVTKPDEVASSGDEKKDTKKKDEKALRLIIIEDSAELFSDNCRSTPGFARLLNISDGIIGQGLRCVFLLTANEELGKIDPAIRRPGRCIQCLEFPALSKDQANKWLIENGCKQRVKDDTMLAELYGYKSAKIRKELLAPKTQFGFVASGFSK